MSPQTNRNVLIGMVAGVVLGAVAGMVIPDVMLFIGVIGRLFVNALQILLLPLIPAVIIAGVAGLGQASKMGRATASTLVYFLGTTAIAVVIGTVLVLVFQPGNTVSPAGAFIPDMVARARATTFTDIFSAFIPDNLISAIYSGQYLGLVVFSLVFGAVIGSLGAKTRIVVDFFKAIAEIAFQVTTLVLYVAPLGLFVLVGTAVARNPEAIASVADNLLWLTLTFLIAVLVHGLIVLPLLARFYGHRNPADYAGKTLPAMVTAFGTASSVAALPVTFRNVVDDANVDARAGSLVLPLGAAMNANGTAMYLAIAAFFTAQLFGLQLGILNVIAIALLSVILSLGTAGVPGGALFSLAIIFSTLNYPVEAYGAIGLLGVVDWLFDRGRAMLNVWGDIVGAAVIGESFEFKTARVTRMTTGDDRATGHRERIPARRERRSDEGPESRRPHREPREAAPARERTPRGRGRQPERPPQERPPADRPRARFEAQKPPEARREPRPPVSRSPQPPRERRPEPRHAQRREQERPAPLEPKPQPQVVSSAEEVVTEKRERVAPPTPSSRPEIPVPQIPSAAVPKPSPERQPEPERQEAPKGQEEPERAEIPEIRRRPLPTESRMETSRDESGRPEFRAPRERASEPEVEPRREEIPFRPAEREPAEETEPEPARPVTEAPPETERPRLRELLSGLSASREAREESLRAEESEGADKEPAESQEPAEEDHPISYGRGKSRHGGRPGGAASPEQDEARPETESAPPVERKEDLTVEPTSFGRQRRKRTR